MNKVKSERKSRTAQWAAWMLSGALFFPQAGFSQSADYYSEGRATAEKEYNNSEVRLMGLFSGGFFSLVGWSVGWLTIANNQSVTIPAHHLAGLDDRESARFESGYKDYVLRQRAMDYNVAAGMGVLLSREFRRSILDERDS